MLQDLSISLNVYVQVDSDKLYLCHQIQSKENRRPILFRLFLFWSLLIYFFQICFSKKLLDLLFKLSAPGDYDLIRSYCLCYLPDALSIAYEEQTTVLILSGFSFFG
jgi:hypothetical protein